MVNHSSRERLVAVCLAALAGYVDALAFISLGGYFVSFMSGNTTRLGASLAENWTVALLPLGLIALFVLGVIGGSVVAKLAGTRRPQAVTGTVAILLLLAALAAGFDLRWMAIVAMALAMGAENAVFERNGEVSIGLTYMTGALVKLGQRLAAAFLGGERWGWAWYLLLWLGLATGAVAGSFAFLALDLAALWPAAAIAAAISLYLTLWPFGQASG